ncbi:MAG: hypothetical protein RL757_251 [Bacteroidota bacterium]|jgi:hypothetical protein
MEKKKKPNNPPVKAKTNAEPTGITDYIDNFFGFLFVVFLIYVASYFFLSDIFLAFFGKETVAFCVRKTTIHETRGKEVKNYYEFSANGKMYSENLDNNAIPEGTPILIEYVPFFPSINKVLDDQPME